MTNGTGKQRETIAENLMAKYGGPSPAQLSLMELRKKLKAKADHPPPVPDKKSVAELQYALTQLGAEKLDYAALQDMINQKANAPPVAPVNPDDLLSKLMNK